MAREDPEEPARREQFSRIFGRLVSGSPTEREVAEAELLGMGPEGMALLVARLNGAVRARRRLPWTVLGLGIVSLALGIGAALAVCWLLGRSSTIVRTELPIIYVVLFTALIVRALKESRNSAARALARFDDVRAAGPLLDALPLLTDDAARQHVRAALVPLLPRLKASDSPLLTTAQYRCLCRLLADGRPDHNLKKAVLAALEQVGDAEALPYVERLADPPPGADGRVTEAARRCLPALRERAEREAVGARLLRPAQAPDGEATLLRPAGGAPDARPEALLRPSAGPEEDEARVRPPGP